MVSLSRDQFRRGLIVTLDGLSLWFLAIVATTYLSGSALPWQSVGEFLVSFRTHTVAWLSAPHVNLIAGLAYLGMTMTVVGPAWYWVRPWLVAGGGGETDIPDSGRHATTAGDEGKAWYFGLEPPSLWRQPSRTGLTRAWRMVKAVLVFGAALLGVLVLVFAFATFVDIFLHVLPPGMAVVAWVIGSFLLLFVPTYIVFRVIREFPLFDTNNTLEDTNTTDCTVVETAGAVGTDDAVETDTTEKGKATDTDSVEESDDTIG